MNLSKTPKIISLKNRTEITDLLSCAEKVRTKFGIIFLKKEPGSTRSIGILIKKNTGNAVQRNYSKRIIRSFVRLQAAKLAPYNKITFLYLYKGKTNYHKLEENFLVALKKYEQNIINTD